MRAIVNYSTEGFSQGQERLKESLEDYGISDFYLTPKSLRTPKHEDNPYAFKLKAIERALDAGFEQILWLDASVYAVKDPSPVFDWMDSRGVFMEEAGHWVGNWCPPNVLEYFGITKEEAMKMPMFSAGFVGIDFMTPVGLEFFDLWYKSMKAGMFKGDWETHRHDMTCGSIIANQMGLVPLYSPVCQFFYPIGCGYEGDLSKVVFHLQGL